MSIFVHGGDTHTCASITSGDKLIILNALFLIFSSFPNRLTDYAYYNNIFHIKSGDVIQSPIRISFALGTPPC